MSFHTSDTMPSQIDKIVRRLVPSASSAIITGSTVMRANYVEPDLDVIALSKLTPEGKSIDINENIGDIKVNISVYNYLHFLALAQSSELVFYHLREIRKLLVGEIVFDDGIAHLSRCVIKRAEICHRKLQGMLRKAELQITALKKVHHYSKDLFVSVEYAIFLKMHSKIETRYSKHKYLLEDSKHLPTPTLTELMQETANTLLRSPEWPRILLAHENTLCQIGGGCAEGPIRDSVALLKNGMKLEAVFPFRYALVKLINHTDNDASENDIEFIVNIGFCLKEAMEPRILSLLERCISEVKKDVNFAP